MANKIQLKRGLKSRLTTLSAGEPAYTTDTRELFIGTGSGNVNMGGSQWYTGTAMSGTSAATTYYYSACPLVKLGDIYLNTSNGNVYQCTTAGSGTTARWTYKGNIKGPAGAAGDNVYSTYIPIARGEADTEDYVVKVRYTISGLPFYLSRGQLFLVKVDNGSYTFENGLFDDEGEGGDTYDLNGKRIDLKSGEMYLCKYQVIDGADIYDTRKRIIVIA